MGVGRFSLFHPGSTEPFFTCFFQFGICQWESLWHEVKGWKKREFFSLSGVSLPHSLPSRSLGGDVAVVGGGPEYSTQLPLHLGNKEGNYKWNTMVASVAKEVLSEALTFFLFKQKKN